MAKAKSKFVLVLLESIVSKHKFVQQRARLDDKLELWKFDPYIQKFSIYKEIKKVKSLK
ncbi:mitochondrial ribosomal protein L33 [Haemaphysalis longicornis]